MADRSHLKLIQGGRRPEERPENPWVPWIKGLVVHFDEHFTWAGVALTIAVPISLMGAWYAPPGECLLLIFVAVFGAASLLGQAVRRSDELASISDQKREYEAIFGMVRFMIHLGMIIIFLLKMVTYSSP